MTLQVQIKLPTASLSEENHSLAECWVADIRLSRSSIACSITAVQSSVSVDGAIGKRSAHYAKPSEVIGCHCFPPIETKFKSWLQFVWSLPLGETRRRWVSNWEDAARVLKLLPYAYRFERIGAVTFTF
jgi:hypothetical protein